MVSILGTPQVESLLEKMDDGEYSSSELMALLGLRDRKNFQASYLNPAMEAGFIERTIPEKPRSSKQRYRRIKGCP